jgi:hypothetical protein
LSPSNRRDAVLTPSEVYQRKLEMLSLIEFIPDTGCWKFNDPTDRGGYGRGLTGGKERKAHECLASTTCSGSFDCRPSGFCVLDIKQDQEREDNQVHESLSRRISRTQNVLSCSGVAAGFPVSPL